MLQTTIPQVDSHAMVRAILSTGPSLLNKKYQHLWSSSNPMRGYCWLVSMLVAINIRPDLKVFKVPVDNDPLDHYFLKDTTGVVYDLTGSQFNGANIPYNMGKPVSTGLGKQSGKVIILYETYLRAIPNAR